MLGRRRTKRLVASGLVSDWDGHGLPPIAQQRIERARSSGVRTSLLSVPSQTGLDASGFYAVGEVMGCGVVHLGFQGYGGCGWNPMTGYGYPQFTVTARSGGYFGLGPYQQALEGSWQLALSRMLEEATGLGADGVVGVRLTEEHLGEGNREFVALEYCPVRSIAGTHLTRPFSTTLGGDDVTKLLASGFMPAGTIVAISLGIRHDDYATRQATMMFAGNVEVPGYSELVHVVRSDVRDELHRRTAALGADGAILTLPMSLVIHELEVSEGHRDHVALATLVASAIVATGTPVKSAAHPIPIVFLSDVPKAGNK